MSWSETNLGTVATLQRGFDLPSRLRQSGRVPIVSSSGVSGWHNRAMAAAPGVVTGRYGTIGEVFFQNIDFWPLNTTLWVSNFHGNDERFIYYLLQRVDYATHSGKSGVPGVNRNDLHTETISLPSSIDEQRQISAALNDADELIATLKRLIAKKQAVKQGMMQQLLTGRTRLPGFSGTWAETQIGNLLEFKNGLNKGSEYFGVGTPIVNFMDVMNGPIVQSGDVRGCVTLTRDEIKRFSARKGDLFFTRTSETVDEVGTAAVLVEDIADACFSGFILRGRPRSADVEPRFLARAFGLDAVRAQVMASATYTTRALTNGRSLGNVELCLPPVDEQCAISEVLDDVDAEIGGLSASLTKSRAMKTGMLQQLLTGRVRLPTEDAS